MSTALIAAFKAGDQAAFVPLFSICHPFAQHLARLNLARPATSSDAEEVASSILMAFFREVTGRCDARLAAGLTDTESLRRAIALLARQKARKWVRRNLAARRDRRREIPLHPDVAERPAPPANADLPLDWASLVALPALTPRQRQILELRRELDSWDAVAERLGVGRRTVFRELVAIRQAAGR